MRRVVGLGHRLSLDQDDGPAARARRAGPVQGDVRASRGRRRDRARAGARGTRPGRPVPGRRRRRGDDGGAAPGARRRDRRRRVRDPLDASCAPASRLLEDGGAAIVEVAQASGLGLVAADERDAEAASSRGTGEPHRPRSTRAPRSCSSVRRQRQHRRRRRRDRGAADGGGLRGAHWCASATSGRRSSARPRCSARRRAPTRPR